MSWGMLRLGNREEYERYYNETEVPTTAKMERFRGRQLLRSLENPDEGILLTFWENSQDLEKNARTLDAKKLREQAKVYIQGVLSQAL